MLFCEIHVIIFDFVELFMQKEKLGRDPSRADMFIACYAKPDGTPISQVAGEKIVSRLNRNQETATCL